MRPSGCLRIAGGPVSKMTARLQAATASDNPVLLRFETKAGHGIGAPTQKVVDEYAGYLSFISWRLGMNLR